MMHRTTFAKFRTLERAVAALEEFFAMGELCEGEHPRIEREPTRAPGAERARWLITVATEYA